MEPSSSPPRRRRGLHRPRPARQRIRDLEGQVRALQEQMPAVAEGGAQALGAAREALARIRRAEPRLGDTMRAVAEILEPALPPAALRAALAAGGTGTVTVTVRIGGIPWTLGFDAAALPADPLPAWQQALAAARETP